MPGNTRARRRKKAPGQKVQQKIYRPIQRLVLPEPLLNNSGFEGKPGVGLGKGEMAG